mmetsp:Transcript_118947/g.167160  ORF Transcript_118947/g.167160 Transcript_118947/m.167160 type:complete len:108 (-) Transcript_118947:28-351(-)
MNSLPMLLAPEYALLVLFFCVLAALAALAVSRFPSWSTTFLDRRGTDAAAAVVPEPGLLLLPGEREGEGCPCEGDELIVVATFAGFGQSSMEQHSAHIKTTSASTHP